MNIKPTTPYPPKDVSTSTLTKTMPIVSGVSLAIAAIALLASCAAPQTTTQITALNSKVTQLEQELTTAKNAQPGTLAKIVELNLKVTRLETDLAAAKKATGEPYVIGLGEIMGLTQMRHSKLWFAGNNQNWPLAEYELAELKEGFDDVMKFHPTHDGVPQPLTEMVPQFTDAALASLDKAVAAKDKAQFEAAFDGLTNACNSCHTAANFSFNVITRPTALAYTNQSFAPKP